MNLISLTTFAISVFINNKSFFKIFNIEKINLISKKIKFSLNPIRKNYKLLY